MVFKEACTSGRIYYDPELVGVVPKPAATPIPPSSPSSSNLPDLIPQKVPPCTKDLQVQFTPVTSKENVPVSSSIPPNPIHPLKQQLKLSLTRSGPLDCWCVPATAETIKRDHDQLDRMHEDVLEEREEEESFQNAQAKPRMPLRESMKSASGRNNQRLIVDVVMHLDE